MAPRTGVGEHHAGQILPQIFGIPEAACRHGCDSRRRGNREILRRFRHPIEEWLPDGVRLLLVEALEHHAKTSSTLPRPEGCRLAPVRIEERVAVEADEAADQAPESCIGESLDRHQDTAEEFRQLACPSVSLVITPDCRRRHSLMAQNKSGFVQAFAVRRIPSAVTISACRRPAAAMP